MSKTCLVYRGFTIEAAAFELGGTGHFTSSLKISAPGSTLTDLVDLPITHHLFPSAAEALSMTLAQGRTLVDSLAIDKTRG
jgi:hypothetical protein